VATEFLEPGVRIVLDYRRDGLILRGIKAWRITPAMRFRSPISRGPKARNEPPDKTPTHVEALCQVTDGSFLLQMCLHNLFS